MAITNRTRKILWGRSGNRCAICRRELVLVSNFINNDSVIGEECHIVAREIEGPRGNSSLPIKSRDNIDNLLLLCRNHHKVIDDQFNTFTIDKLRAIKSKHEEWVRESLSVDKKNHPNLFNTYRVDSGTQLWGTVIECDGYSFDTVQPKSEFEAYLLGNFTQNITDYGDIRNIIGSRDRILAQFELDEQIKELNEGGFLIYATSQRQRLVLTDTKKTMDVVIGYTLILREENPKVQRKDEEIEKIMQVKGQTQNKFSNFVSVFLDTSSSISIL